MSLRFLIPVAVFAGISGAMLYALFYLDPTHIPSELVNKPAPQFQLEEVPGYGPGLATADLNTGKLSLLNVFASWCVACLAEHPALMALSRRGDVEIYGLNYKDTAENAATWLQRNGNPYHRTGMDLKGRVGIDFGVYGVPETFIMGPDGTILDKIIGPITERDLAERILPRIEEFNH